MARDPLCLPSPIPAVPQLCEQDWWLGVKTTRLASRPPGARPQLGKLACTTAGGTLVSKPPPLSTDITIKVEDPDCLSSSSYRDVENERFLSSSSSTARRVSFNEAALFDQGKKTQEKGRR